MIQDHEGLNYWREFSLKGIHFCMGKLLSRWVHKLTTNIFHRFLLTSFYTKYDFNHFAVNFATLLLVLIPKLPQFHMVRLFGINKYWFLPLWTDRGKQKNFLCREDMVAMLYIPSYELQEEFEDKFLQKQGRLVSRYTYTTFQRIQD